VAHELVDDPSGDAGVFQTLAPMLTLDEAVPRPTLAQSIRSPSPTTSTSHCARQ
jgi:hypothetical protein